jgi:hypothetical protein
MWPPDRVRLPYFACEVGPSVSSYSQQCLVSVHASVRLEWHGLHDASSHWTDRTKCILLVLVMPRMNMFMGIGMLSMAYVLFWTINRTAHILLVLVIAPGECVHGHRHAVDGVCDAAERLGGLGGAGRYDGAVWLLGEAHRARLQQDPSRHPTQLPCPWYAVVPSVRTSVCHSIIPCPFVCPAIKFLQSRGVGGDLFQENGNRF